MTSKLDKFAIKNLTAVIIGAQIVVYLAMMAGYINPGMLSISYYHIFNGEIWRVITFLFIPPSTSPIWAILSWFILYIMGINLEHYWGEFRFNIYILLAVVLTNMAAYIFGWNIATNYYLQSSIFLAFAFLNGNFQVRLFFILPVKIKWIAMLNWVYYLFLIVVGGLADRVLILASLMNFFIFFSKDIYYKLKYRSKRVKNKVENKVMSSRPKHQCVICGKSDISHPHTDFRYCSTCNPEQCYCEDHLNNHDHIL